jgi:hypothetical protein
MAKFRLTIWLLSALALVLGFCGPSHAQTSITKRPLAFSPFPFQANFGLSPGLFKNAKFFSYQQILAQTLADRSPDAAEVHTYLANPVQWQKNLMKSHTYELGLPRSRVILADGSIIRTYLRPQIPKSWSYHLFSDPPPKGFVELTLYDPTHLYIIQTPPGSQLLQQLFVRNPGQPAPLGKGGGKTVTIPDLQKLLPKL